ncbi:disease resistance protein At4g27190-like isoform X3 [Populus trichocarpa]|uniref:disease resistance protein At4g27190-like isoform X3 n=1 Tax=Populus trichocarpa TaxID=3694 RepID=UPI002278DDB7|nr:disease resistance protein At4g27190-like isoform X3 [Populus trichocarpa]
MLRQNDPVLHHVDRSFWEYVEKMDDGRMRCKFCGHCFAERTSISRIKLHLAGVTGRGVKTCGQVPPDVQDAALAAIDGPQEKKLKTLAGSSNNDVTNEISPSAQQQNNEMMMARQREDLWLEDLVTSITVEDMELLERGSFHERPSFYQADEPRGDPSQPTNDQLCSPSVNNDVIVNDAQNVFRVRTEPVVQVLEQSNAELENLSVDAGRTQVGVQGMEHGWEEERVCSHLDMENSMENTGEGSVQHVDRIVSPWRHAIDENYSRRGAIERLVQPGVGASSSGGNVIHHGISTSPQEQNNEVDNLTGDATRIQAPDMYEKSLQEMRTFLMKDDMESNSGRSLQPGAGARSSVGLKHNTSETRGAPLPTGSTKLVGRAFEENRKVIWSWLMDEEVSTIGIYGMGGAGKTTMLKHIYNELQRIANISPHVYWVTVSRDFSIHTLQKKIAKCINLSLSIEEEELHIAVKLSLELKKKQRWILILDDLWNSFELYKVGIPVSLKECKLIITTRSETVCRQMNSRNNLRVNPLSNKEAWTLFTEILGHDTRLSPEVEQIAKFITRECDGLPLGIKTIAGTMKGVDDIHEWSDALEDLRQSRVMQDKVEEEVFHILRFSYTHLSDRALQRCFLYCALFPEDSAINRLQLIRYLIDEGVVKGQKSREAGINKGHTMLNRLENVCLLERLHGGDFVKMHDLIRDMAIQKLQENSQAIVEAGEQLEELPDAEEWTEKLTTVSLMHNRIEEICSSHSVRCPNLSTLLLCSNHRLRFIAGSFFEQMHGLKVLDLSNTAIECLPDSVSDLVGLTSLLLNNCQRLSRVPSLKKLRALKRLDLSRTPLKKIPHGMKCLSNLRYLRMNGCGEKKFPCGIIPKLSHLQVLILEDWVDRVLNDGRMGKEIYAAVIVEGKEVGCLRKLESLECHFEDRSNYVEYLKSRDETQSLRTYKIVVGQFKEDEGWEFKYNQKSNIVVLGNLNINRDGDFQVISSNDIQQLICKCIDARSLGDVLSLKYATELEYIKILNCNSMESLVSSSWLCSAPLPQPSPSCNGIFSGLKRLYCSGCKGMKKLFPPVLLPYLVNLERIDVKECEKMEEIIGGARSDEEGDMGEESSVRNTEFKFPKLRELHLGDLPELKSICSAKLICDSLQVIEVRNCSIIEVLVPSSWIHLVNLEEIIVNGCEKMEEIIGGTRSDEEGDMGEQSSIRNTEFKLPKLRELHLGDLPELKSICSAKLICDSLQKIEVRNCSIREILVPSSWIGLVNLEEIVVEGCEKMEEIIGGARSDEEGVMGEESSIRNTEFKLPKLRHLYLKNLLELKSICSAKLICDSLEVIEVWNCSIREILVPSSWIRLVKLKVIVVGRCVKMEEIIGGTRSDEEGVMGEESSSSTELNFPQLKTLKLIWLPELRSICSAKLICDSMKLIHIRECQKLKRMPICLPLLENGQPSPPSFLRDIYATPKEWWESEVEWEHPNTKDVLRRFVRFG